MAHLADIIEEFILRQMGERDEATVLQRNELAESLNCAPSQISYVLNTRFTLERGFVVESRRGSGGYVRIVRISGKQVIYENVAQKVMTDAQVDTAEDVIAHLKEQGLLNSREAELLLQFFRVTQERLGSVEQARVLRAILLRLAEFREGGL